MGKANQSVALAEYIIQMTKRKQNNKKITKQKVNVDLNKARQTLK